MTKSQIASVMALIQRGHFREAEFKVKNVLATDPKNSDGIALFAFSLAAQGKVVDAVRLINTAIAIQPDNSYYHYLHALFLYRQHKFAEANGMIEKAITLDSNSAEYFGLQALIKLVQKKWKAALYASNRGLTIDPENVTCLNARSTAKNLRSQARHQAAGYRGPVSLVSTSYINATFLDVSGIAYEAAAYLLERYLDHHYDLLGSGWVQNSYFSTSLGVEGQRYESRFDFVIDTDGNWLAHILDEEHVVGAKSIIKLWNGRYEPIDWQKDYKSGYRWSQKQKYTKQPIGHLEGADIKVPWELARMQHLVQLAMFAVMFKDKKDAILREFRNQVLDFIATNPPQWGVNWVYAMDVGIRAANLLVAYDILKQIDQNDILDEEFCGIFARSMYQHGNHIICNLEHSRGFKTNHYIANIAGLLFIAAYLEPAPKTDFWLVFAAQEIIIQLKNQFYSDGGNFESSTAYHSLSTQMVTFATAIMLGISKERMARACSRTCGLYPFLKRPKIHEYNLLDSSLFPDWYVERLFRAGLFLQDVTKPNDNIAQIGDNDSGRFFRLTPNGNFLTAEEAENTYINLRRYQKLRNPQPYSSLFWNENVLNYIPVLAGIAALFPNGSFSLASRKFPLEYSLIRLLSNGKTFHAPVFPKTDRLYSTSDQVVLSFRKEIVLRYKCDSSFDLVSNLRLRAYFESGIYILKSEDLFISLCACPNGQNNRGGHGHNDKLALEVNFQGHDIVIDPGSYLYTAAPEKRNNFRSATAHATLQTGREQNQWTDDPMGLFRLKNESTCYPLSLSNSKISVKLTYDDVIQIRTVSVLGNRIIIFDESNKNFTHHLQPFQWFSDGYGKLKTFDPEIENFEITYYDDC